MMNVYSEIKKLVTYGIEKGIIAEEDVIYTVNRLLEKMDLVDYTDPDIEGEQIVLVDVLKNLTDYAYEHGLIDSDDVVIRDIFDTGLMGILTPAPSVCIERFRADYAEDPVKATNNYYQFCKDTNYLRTDRISRDLKWSVASDYGTIDININLSKPEKDPKAIATMKHVKESSYPKCQLCMENEGYGGRRNHPARQNHRIIPLTINGTKWGFQYSPYVYYNEHCIVFNGEHIPMKIDHAAFVKLFDFVKQFPHYFLGSNADLPIVGGSILTHDHFQGGHYTFAMERARVEKYYVIPGFEDVKVGMLYWPLSVIRIQHRDSDRLIELADHILGCWRGYTDEAAYIYAVTDGEPHNTITPIVRKKGDLFEMDLALRNNIRTEECPMGLYHPHAEYHHIKKENIGLIEVMGLAILPPRLKKSMDLIIQCVEKGESFRDHPELDAHADWLADLGNRYEINSGNIEEILKEEIGKVFVKVLENAGVYKCDEKGREDFERFILSL